MKYKYLFIVMALLFSISGMQAKDRLTYADFSIAPGEEKDIAVGLEIDSLPIVYTAFQFDITLPKGIKIKTNSRGKMQQGISIHFAEGRTVDQVFAGAAQNDSTWRFLAYSMTQTPIEGTTGDFFYITVVADDTIPEGVYSSRIFDIIFTDPVGTSFDKNNPSVGFVDLTNTVTVGVPTTVTANDTTRVYGDENPAFTYRVEGGTLKGEPSLTTTATKASPVGEYDIVPSQGTVTNALVTYVNGKLTVTKAPLTITPKNYTREYGEDNPVFEADYSGFKNNDTTAVLTKQPTITCAATKTSAPGQYDIIASGAEADNYDISYVVGKLTITKAPLTITANDTTREYGEANPKFTASYTGLKNNDTEDVLTTKPTMASSAVATSKVGTYDITASGAVSDKYDITYKKGILTIAKAPLTIAANDTIREYGEENPEFTLAYTGFKNDETEAVIDTKPTVTCDATATSELGQYDIVVSGAADDNYDITCQNGTLTVSKALITIQPNDASREYGDANPEFTVSYSGFKNGDTEDVVTTKPTVTCEAVATSKVGTYDIVASGAVSEKYDFVYKAGKLTITKALLTIKVNDATKEYGDPDPEFTFTYSGFKNNESESALISKPRVAIDTTSFDVGTYLVWAWGAKSDNYKFNCEDGHLTITKAPLVVKAGDYQMIQGEQLPEFHATYEGFKFNDTEANAISPLPTFSTDIKSSSVPGVYTVTVSGADARNYELTYVNGTLTINVPDGIYGVYSDFKEPTNVYNTKGQMVRYKATDLKGLPSGVYIVNGKKVVVK